MWRIVFAAFTVTNVSADILSGQNGAVGCFASPFPMTDADAAATAETHTERVPSVSINISRSQVVWSTTPKPSSWPHLASSWPSSTSTRNATFTLSSTPSPSLVQAKAAKNVPESYFAMAVALATFANI